MGVTRLNVASCMWASKIGAGWAANAVDAVVATRDIATLRRILKANGGKHRIAPEHDGEAKLYAKCASMGQEAAERPSEITCGTHGSRQFG